MENMPGQIGSRLASESGFSPVKVRVSKTPFFQNPASSGSTISALLHREQAPTSLSCVNHPFGDCMTRRIIRNWFFPHSLSGLCGYCFHPWCPDGRACGWWVKACPGCISETVRCKMSIFGGDIGLGVEVYHVIV